MEKARAIGKTYENIKTNNLIGPMWESFVFWEKQKNDWKTKTGRAFPEISIEECR